MTTTHSMLGRHWLRSLLMLLVLAHCLGLQAQQAQERRRCKTGFLLPEFSDAKIMQSFGRYVKAKANILIKGAALCYMEDGKVMKAKTDGIFGVNFGDTLRYVKVNGAMARVVAQKKYHQLLCVTQLDENLYREERLGTSDMSYFDASDLNIFMQLDGLENEAEKGVPLCDTYYFSVKGRIIRANETEFKKVMDPGQKQAFKVLMGNRFWSWKDEESLKMLLDFLPL